jgi:serine/threonine protein kinase
VVGDGGPAGEGSRLAGRYRLEVRLGEQYGSSVWRATDEVLARQVAVRTFTPGLACVGEVVAAARAASRLRDQRLVQVFDADDRPEHPYVVTEFPSGAQLGDLLTAGPLTPVHAAEIIAEAADALAVAHMAGLAHLCLTPDSLWCDARAEVKVSGLGTAAALTGAHAADPALADTQGLARLLYAAVTGCWPGETQTTLPPAPRSGGRPCDPRQVRAEIPRHIGGVICRALFGEAGADGLPILGPSQLSMELAAITHSGLRTPPAMPAPASRATPTPVQPPPDGWRPWDDTASSESALPGPARPTRRAGMPVTAKKALRAAGVLAVLAAIAAGGWVLAHQAPAAERAPPAHPPATATPRTHAPVSAGSFDPRR